MFVELQILHDDDLGCHVLTVVFHGETDDLVYAHSNILNFHVLFVFRYVVGDTRQAATVRAGQDR